MQTLNLTKKYEKYPEYKDSGVDWLGKIPKEWRVGKVKETFKLLKEKSFNNSESEILSLTLNGIKTRDVSNNEGQIASSYEGYRKIIKGDVVLNPMDLIRGFVDSSKYEGIISPAYSTLRKIDKNTNSDFYGYFFQKHYFEGIFYPFGNGVSVDHRWTLKDDTLVNFPLLIVPNSEQIKIANYLDEKTQLIDKIIEKKEKLIDLLKEKRTAVINNAVINFDKNNIKNEKIKHLVLSIESGIWGENQQGDDNDIKCLRVADFDYENFSFNDVKTIRNNLGLSKQKILQVGDILMEKSGGGEKTPVGRAILFDSNQKMVCANFVDIVRVDKQKILPKFLVLILSVLYSGRINTKYIKQNTGIQNIDIKNYFGETVSFPEIEAQRDIIKFTESKLSDFKKSLLKIENSIELLKEFKTSLISNVVTGKIKV